VWNAHVATGVPLAEYGALSDTVSVCLSKGLGAPVGSVLVSSAERIARARILRKRYGAGMRQVGILAAAGRYALDHQLTRLADDHAHARRIAQVLATNPRVELDLATVQTNIVVFRLRDGAPDAATVAERARERGVLLYVFGARTLRAVTHLDVSAAQVARAGQILRELLG